MVEGSSDLEQQRKAWRQRNSDGRNTFEGERTQGPPGFTLTEYALPLTDSQRLGQPSDTLAPNPADPDDTDALSASARDEPDGAAIVHAHTYDVEDPDA